MEITKVNEILQAIYLHKETSGKLDTDDAIKKIALVLTHLAESIHSTEVKVSKLEAMTSSGSLNR